MARNFMNTLKYRGYLKRPREAGFVDIEDLEPGVVRAWSPDGLAGISYELGDDNGIVVWAIDRAGLPVAEGEGQDAWSATRYAAEEWARARARARARAAGDGD